jgi:hypothetical protein
MLSPRAVILNELRQLGATQVRTIENGGRNHPRILAQFDGRELEMPAPRGTRKDRGHLRQNYISDTRRRVRAFRQQRGA